MSFIVDWLFGCKCFKLPSWVIANKYSKLFNSMQQIDIKKNHFTRLKKCKKCTQSWQVDAVDADYKTLGFAIKIKDPEHWSLLSDFQSRKEAMIENHGGISKETCKWKHCHNNAMFDMVFCVECAYNHMNQRI